MQPSQSPAGAEPTIDELRQAIVDVLKTVYDPEIPVDIYELGLIYGLEIDEERHVKIVMTLTSPMCPVAESLPPEVEQKVRGVPGVAHVDLELTWEPAWDPSRMSEVAKLELGY
jgi:FeS assembly SUF system protein